MTFSAPFGRIFRPPFGPAVSIGGNTAYMNKVIGYGPIAYWPLNEAAGATSVACLINSLQNGTPASVTFANTTGPDGANAPLFDGLTSYINVFTATLAGVFNGDEGAMGIWLKVLNAGVWADGKTAFMFSLYASANNRVRLYKSSNLLSQEFRAGGELETNASGAQTSTDWLHLGLRWSLIAGKVEYFYNGIETGAEDVHTTAWSGALTVARVGKNYTSDANYWNGWLAHAAVFNSAVSDAVMLGLGTAP